MAQQADEQDKCFTGSQNRAFILLIRAVLIIRVPRISRPKTAFPLSLLCRQDHTAPAG